MLPIGVRKVENTAFSRCTSLVTMAIPNPHAELCVHAFEECYNLRYVIAPALVGVNTLFDHFGSTDVADQWPTQQPLGTRRRRCGTGVAGLTNAASTSDVGG
eukprot:m.46097 g.46097  ORF g.46097 m.46097 type:complete len:102 (+) comp8714_c0_seq1:1404-1709(+)